MKKSVNFWTRKLHRWGAVACCIPLLLVVISGLLLQVKKQVPWVQPPSQKAPHPELRLTWNEILEASRRDPDAGIRNWEDIDRLDVRPGDGVVKVQPHSRRELQIDLATGEILSSTWRRSDLIEQLHDGSFFGEWVKLGVFLPNGLVLLGLWLTGAWLWYLPWKARAAKRRRMSAAQRKNQQQPAD